MPLLRSQKEVIYVMMITEYDLSARAEWRARHTRPLRWSLTGPSCRRQATGEACDAVPLEDSSLCLMVPSPLGDTVSPFRHCLWRASYKGGLNGGPQKVCLCPNPWNCECRLLGKRVCADIPELRVLG